MNTDFIMDNYCFACGADNDHGLKLKIKQVAGQVETQVRLPLWTQGYKRNVHGGIISTILDEMAVWAAFHRGFRCITGELHVRIRNAMQVEMPYTVTARVIRVKHRLVEALSEIINGENTLIASARAKLVRVD